MKSGSWVIRRLSLLRKQFTKEELDVAADLHDIAKIGSGYETLPIPHAESGTVCIERGLIKYGHSIS